MELEDFMRQQFNSENPAERFPFREEYWEQAKVLLEAAEQQHRRRKFFWWCFGIGLSLLVAAGGYFALRTRVSNKTVLNDSLSANKAAARLEEGLSGAKSELPLVSTPTGSEPKVNGVQKNAGMPSSAAQSAEATVHPGSKRRDLRQLGTLKSVTSTLEKGPTAIQPISLPSVQDADRVQSILPDKPGKSAMEAGPTTQVRQLGLAALPLPNFRLLPSKIAQPQVNKPSTITPFNNTDKKGLGIATGAPMYPDAPGGRRAGAVIGLYGAAEFRQHWTISLGIQWRYRPVTTLETNPTDQQLRYSFGYTLDTWERINWAVSYLELPFSVQRHWRRRNVELGFSPGMMLGATDHLKHQRYTLYPETTTLLDSKPQKGDKLEYNPLYISMFAGAGYKLGRHIECYGRLFYRPDGLRKNNRETGGVNSKIWPELGVRLGL